jgi:hypothetical protein
MFSEKIDPSAILQNKEHLDLSMILRSGVCIAIDIGEE